MFDTVICFIIAGFRSLSLCYILSKEQCCFSRMSVCVPSSISGVWASGVDFDWWDGVPPCSCTGVGNVCVSLLLGAYCHSLPLIPDHGPHQDSPDPMENSGE